MDPEALSESLLLLGDPGLSIEEAVDACRSTAGSLLLLEGGRMEGRGGGGGGDGDDDGEGEGDGEEGADRPPLGALPQLLCGLLAATLPGKEWAGNRAVPRLRHAALSCLKTAVEVGLNVQLGGGGGGIGEVLAAVINDIAGVTPSASTATTTSATVTPAKAHPRSSGGGGSGGRLPGIPGGGNPDSNANDVMTVLHALGAFYGGQGQPTGVNTPFGILVRRVWALPRLWPDLTDERKQQLCEAAWYAARQLRDRNDAAALVDVGDRVAAYLSGEGGPYSGTVMNALMVVSTGLVSGLTMAAAGVINAWQADTAKAAGGGSSSRDVRAARSSSTPMLPPSTSSSSSGGSAVGLRPSPAAATATATAATPTPEALYPTWPFTALQLLANNHHVVDIWCDLLARHCEARWGRRVSGGSGGLGSPLSPSPVTTAISPRSPAVGPGASPLLNSIFSRWTLRSMLRALTRLFAVAPALIGGSNRASLGPCLVAILRNVQPHAVGAMVVPGVIEGDDGGGGVEGSVSADIVAADAALPLPAYREWGGDEGAPEGVTADALALYQCIWGDTVPPGT